MASNRDSCKVIWVHMWGKLVGFNLTQTEFDQISFKYSLGTLEEQERAGDELRAKIFETRELRSWKKKAFRNDRKVRGNFADNPGGASF